MPAGFDLDAMMYRLLQLRVPKVRTWDIACMSKSLFLLVCWHFSGEKNYGTIWIFHTCPGLPGLCVHRPLRSLDLNHRLGGGSSVGGMYLTQYICIYIYIFAISFVYMICAWNVNKHGYIYMYATDACIIWKIDVCGPDHIFFIIGGYCGVVENGIAFCMAVL